MKKLSTIIHLLIIATILTAIACTPRYTATNHTPIKRHQPFPPFTDTVYQVFIDGAFIESEVDKKAVPIGGENAYLRKTYGNVKYPAQARQNSIQGIVVIEVVVNEFGQMESASIKKDIGYGCGEESLRCIKLAGQGGYEPAIKDGKPVKVKLNMPMKFSLH
ncbi:MAG TPA: TonB family protein [Bacteroidetes bacterium]|nr:TonB family protein [Bacteroidota bacterium]